MEEKTKPKISGIYNFINSAKISEEESERRIKELHEKQFSPFQVTEGSRHGNCFFPMNTEDFFDEINRS